MIDVRDAIDDADDAPFERLWLLRTGVREDPVTHLVGQVEVPGDLQRLLVVTETAPETRRQRVVQGLLAGVSERRVAGVVTEPDCLDEILVQPQSARDDARDRGRLERVRHARPVVVALGVDEDLRLALETAERLRVHEPVAVTLKRRPHPARLLRLDAPAGLVRMHGERRERALLVAADPLFERLR